MSKIVSQFDLSDASTRMLHLFTLMSVVLPLLVLFQCQVNTELLTFPIPYTQIVIMQFPTSTVLPLLLMTITFTLAGNCEGFAEILTHRELLDVIPNRIQDSMYFLSPTIANCWPCHRLHSSDGSFPAQVFPQP